jgi:hypothetical protein
MRYFSTVVVNCLPFLLTCSFYDVLYNVLQIVNDYIMFLSTIVFHLFKLYVLHL